MWTGMILKRQEMGPYIYPLQNWYSWHSLLSHIPEVNKVTSTAGACLVPHVHALPSHPGLFQPWHLLHLHLVHSQTAQKQNSVPNASQLWEQAGISLWKLDLMPNISQQEPLLRTKTFSLNSKKTVFYLRVLDSLIYTENKASCFCCSCYGIYLHNP